MISPDRFSALWRSLLPIGRLGRDGGYLRSSWTPTELACREWFIEEALDRDLVVETDRNGNLWAWWYPEGSGPAGYQASGGRAGSTGGQAPPAGAVVTGSHLDSVPHGGAYDGPLGVVCALLAVDALRERAVRIRRPIGIAVFTEEEGSRFGVACLGSRLLTGALDADRARRLTDPAGVTLAGAMAKAGLDPEVIGAEPDRLAGLSAFVELHVEQGRALADRGAPVGVASAIWPHGRWRLMFTGEPNHAGTTRMGDRHDPMLTLAFSVLAANKEARRAGAHATVGRVEVSPNATNAIAGTATAWLDARAPDAGALESLVSALSAKVGERAGRDGTGFTIDQESASGLVEFHHGLRDRVSARLGGAPVLPTGAGHDAGVLAGHVPTAMLFVRNPSGVSHAPAEYATDADCTAGVNALAEVLEELAC